MSGFIFASAQRESDHFWPSIPKGSYGNTSSLLATYSESQSDASLEALLNTIHRAPLDVDDPEITLSATRIIAKEISLLSCSAGRSRIEMSLMQIVEATLQFRSLAGGELDAIGEMLVSRQQ